MRKIKVAYVCVHNSCRSQMAEAITNDKYNEFFDAYSGGTETKPQINQDAVKIIKKLYDIDMNQTQSSKLVDLLPDDIDILVTMGCNVECPFVPCKHREDWGLDDPTGSEEIVFRDTALLIDSKINDLKNRIMNKKIVL